MSHSSLEYLHHILDEAEYLVERSSALTQKEFAQDETLKRAFVRSLEIIGEATKQVPLQLCNRYDDVDWRAMAGMRDRLIHSYFGVDYEIVWDVVINKVPPLARRIRSIIEAETSAGLV